MKWIFILAIALTMSACFNQGRTPANDGVTPTALKEKDIQIKRSASQFNGFFLGIKEKGARKYYKASDCHFIYENGNESDSDNKEYRYERFMVRFMGINDKGENSLDSVSYTNAGFTKEFQYWDFSKSFGPVKLRSSVKFKNTGENTTLNFVRKENGEVIMTFRHTDAWSTSRSSFFEKNESRDYTVDLIFSEYSKERIKLKKINVQAISRQKGLSPEKVVEVTCTEFSPSEDESL